MIMKDPEKPAHWTEAEMKEAATSISEVYQRTPRLVVVYDHRSRYSEEERAQTWRRDWAV